MEIVNKTMVGDKEIATISKKLEKGLSKKLYIETDKMEYLSYEDRGSAVRELEVIVKIRIPSPDMYWDKEFNLNF